MPQANVIGFPTFPGPLKNEGARQDWSARSVRCPQSPSNKCPVTAPPAVCQSCSPNDDRRRSHARPANVHPRTSEKRNGGRLCGRMKAGQARARGCGDTQRPAGRLGVAAVLTPKETGCDRITAAPLISVRSAQYQSSATNSVCVRREVGTFCLHRRKIRL